MTNRAGRAIIYTESEREVKKMANTRRNKATRMFDAYRMLKGAEANIKGYEEYKAFIGENYKNFELIEKLAEQY